MSDLVCKQCGQEVVLATSERVLYHYPVSDDGTVDWHSGFEEGLQEDEESQQVECGCNICPYQINLEGNVTLTD